jgi:hypothetical protein
VTAPTRIVYGPRNTYRLDPYVRDAGGRFAPAPTTPPPPVADLVAGAVRIDLTNGNGGAWSSGPDPACHWTVRVVREDDGSHRVIYLPN